MTEEQHTLVKLKGMVAMLENHELAYFFENYPFNLLGVRLVLASMKVLVMLICDPVIHY